MLCRGYRSIYRRDESQKIERGGINAGQVRKSAGTPYVPRYGLRECCRGPQTSGSWRLVRNTVDRQNSPDRLNFWRGTGGVLYQLECDLTTFTLQTRQTPIPPLEPLISNMSFRKRNAVISASPASQAVAQSRAEAQLAPGLRPSPLDGRVTTSTGTASLDSILAGHAGLPLGSALLVEEHGTTDFAGALLKYYAAEGLVQGHHVHVLGYPDMWKHELPAVSTKQNSTSDKISSQSDDKMKIAWRYESLAIRHAPVSNLKGESRPLVLWVVRYLISDMETDVDDGTKSVFCHAFDLTKKLSTTSIRGALLSTPASNPMSLSFDGKEAPSAFKLFIKDLQARLQSSPPSTIHRVVVPSLLSPTVYSPRACKPSEVLQFLHALRALLRRYSAQLTVLITLPLSLYPRSNGVTRWIELLSDGVLEMIPLPPKLGAAPPSSNSASKIQDQSQGILRVHSLPIYHEKGGGGAENNHFREDLSFHMSTSKGLVIQPYVLPPLEEEDKKEKSPASTVKDGMDF